MKKSIFVICILFISLCLYAETFTGIFGVKMGDTSESVIKRFNELGWTVDQSSTLKGKDIDVKFNKDGGTYGGKEVTQMQLLFFDNQLYTIGVSVKGEYDIEMMIFVDNILKKFDFTYNQKSYNEFISTTKDSILFATSNDTNLTIIRSSGIYNLGYMDKTIMMKKSQYLIYDSFNNDL